MVVELEESSIDQRLLDPHHYPRNRVSRHQNLGSDHPTANQVIQIIVVVAASGAQITDGKDEHDDNQDQEQDDHDLIMHELVTAARDTGVVDPSGGGVQSSASGSEVSWPGVRAGRDLRDAARKRIRGRTSTEEADMECSRVRRALVVLCVFGTAWSPLRAAGQCCGDCNGDGQVTIAEVIKAVNRALEEPCSDDHVCSGQRFPASGQTTSSGPGSDGNVRAGAALSYADNGDGTITDNNTGLTWEKKDGSRGIHDQDNKYTWGLRYGEYTMNGTMVTEFLAALNTPPCFAAHCDWRIPNVRELHSIVAYYGLSPAVATGPTIPPTSGAVFYNLYGCGRVDGAGGCTDLTRPDCTCTARAEYWSSSTGPRPSEISRAWYVDFADGGVGNEDKAATLAVRAVHGGL